MINHGLSKVTIWQQQDQNFLCTRYRFRHPTNSLGATKLT